MALPSFVGPESNMNRIYTPSYKRGSCIAEAKPTITIVEPNQIDDQAIEDYEEDIEQDSADNFAAPTATNGPISPTGARASPAPQAGKIPNGQPTSPYPERQQSPVGPQAQIAAQTVSSRDPRAAAQQASDMKNVVRRKLTGYVGFANLPNQWHRKSVRKGFNFNVMVVGM